MRKKDRLYTANRWNRPLFRDKNILAYGLPYDWQSNVQKWQSNLQDAGTLVPEGIGAGNLGGTLYKLDKGNITLKPSTPKGLSAEAKAGIGAGAAALGNLAGNLIGNGYSTGAGNAISSIGGIAGSALTAVNPMVGGIVSGASALVGGVTNRLFGAKMNEENIRNIENETTNLRSTQVDDSSTNSIMNQMANQDWGSSFSESDVGQNGLLSSKATDKYNELKTQRELAQSDLNNKYNWAVRNQSANSAYNTMRGLMADGGSIEIKHPGRLTALKKRTGKTEAELWAEGKPEVRKMLVFARNSRKWHKNALGGYLQGKVYDVPEKEIQRLIKAGYEIEYL